MVLAMETSISLRRAGRPRAIPEALEPIVMELYQAGYGYRAIARILREEHGATPSFTSVKRVLVRLGKVNKRRPF